MRINIAVILTVFIFSFVLNNYSAAQSYSFSENKFSSSDKISLYSIFSDSIAKSKKFKGDDFPGKKSPVFAGILSLFLPGSGQIYNGQWIKAGIQWALLAGSVYLAVYNINFDAEYTTMPGTTVAGLVTGGAVWLWSVIDAYISSANINKERRAKYYSGELKFTDGKITLNLNSGRSFSSFNAGLTLNF